MIWKAALAWALVACLAISVSAQPPPPAAPVPPAKKPELGSWWQKNAMKIKPLPTRWLHHVDATLSYLNMSGNAKGSTFDIAANGEIRKNRFTSHTFAKLSRQDISYGPGQGSINYVERTLREQVDFDPAEYITLFAAIETYRNTMVFMDKRLLVYAGLGGRVFRNDKSEVVLNGGLGHASFIFDRAQLLLVNPRQVGIIDTSPSSGGVIGTQTWRWKVSPRFTFTEDATYLKYFKSDLAHRWTVNLTGEFPINKWFSFNVTYRLTEETNVVIEALRVLPRDRTLLMGVKLSI